MLGHLSIIPTPRTVLADGMLAVWRPAEGGITTLDRRTDAEVGRIEDVGGSFAVTATDREARLHETSVTAGFMGRRVVEPLLPDADGGVWIRKTTATRGEVWALAGRADRHRGRRRLSAGPTRRTRRSGDRARDRVTADPLDRLDAGRRPS